LDYPEVTPEMCTKTQVTGGFSLGCAAATACIYAAAEWLRPRLPAELVTFASFDQALNRAAHDIGLPVLAAG